MLCGVWGGTAPFDTGTGNHCQMTLSRYARLWQTPVADDAVNRKQGKINSRGEPKLSAEVKLWPTPTARYHKSDRSTPEWREKRMAEPRGKPLPFVVGGTLNPMWVEWLMGYPSGWTDLKDLEMQSSRRSQK